MKPLWMVFKDSAYDSIYQEHFLPSWNACNAGAFELMALDARTFGVFGEDRFNVSYKFQMLNLREVVAANFGRCIVWSDTDIRFYSPSIYDVETLANDWRVCTAMDGETHCTGYMFFEAGPAILSFIDRWIELNNSKKWGHAQESFNALGERMRALPSTYWNLSFSPLLKPWEPGDVVAVPPHNLILHHANYTKGVENKLKLLEEVRRIHSQSTQ